MMPPAPKAMVPRDPKTSHPLPKLVEQMQFRKMRPGNPMVWKLFLHPVAPFLAYWDFLGAKVTKQQKKEKTTTNPQASHISSSLLSACAGDIII